MVRPFLNTLAVGCVALAGLQALNGAWVIAFLLIGAAIILRAVSTRC
jgi:hypothetical protein